MFIAWKLASATKQDCFCLFFAQHTTVGFSEWWVSNHIPKEPGQHTSWHAEVIIFFYQEGLAMWFLSV